MPFFKERDWIVVGLMKYGGGGGGGGGELLNVIRNYFHQAWLCGKNI